MNISSFLYLTLLWSILCNAPSLWAQDSDADTLLLDEVTIAVTKFADNKLNVPNQVQVIGKREIAFQNTQTAADLLSNSGAAFVQKSQAGGGSPILRGFEANKVLIVVDDVRMNNAIFRGGHLQNILRVDNNVLERAEVVYGTGSLVYGSDALGGVMHFRTLPPKLNLDGGMKASGGAMLRYGTTNNEMTGHARINLGGSKFASLTSVTFSKFGDLRQGASENPFCDTCLLVWQRPLYVETINGVDTVMTNDDPAVQVFTGYQQANLLQKFRYQASDDVSHTLSLQYSNTGDVPRYDRLAEMSGGLPRFAEWYYGPETWLSASYQLRTTKATALHDEMALTAAYQLFKESRHSRRRNRTQTRHQYETVNVITLNADLVKRLGAHRLQYGVEAVYNTVGSEANFTTPADPDAAPEPADTRYPSGGSTAWNASAYLSDRWAVNQNFDVLAGIRFNYASLKGIFDDKTFFNFPFDEASQKNSALVGNLGVNYHTNNGLRVGATLSTGYRTPNIDDLAKVFDSSVGTDSELGILVVPNPDLSPEKTINYELNIEKAFAPRSHVGLTGFFTQLDDALVLAPSTFNGASEILYDGQLAAVYSTQNRDKANIYGISGSLAAGIGNYWVVSARAAYTYGDVVTDSLNTPLDHIAPLFGRVGVAYERPRWQADFYALFNGAKTLDRYRLDGEDNLEDATPNGLPAWFTLNLKASYQVTDFLTIQAGVENLLDTNYRVFASGTSSSGRNILVALRANF